jgi:hypothetical protein
MKLARSIGLCLFVIAALVVVPTGASAASVQHIILPTGTWGVTVTVTGKDAGNNLAFGMTSPQTDQICPTGEEFDCTPGDSKSFSGLSGELVFYLNDVTCGQTFQSTDANSARINQIDSTHWTIGWDDGGGPCGTRDGDFNDLEATVVADSVTPTSTPDFAAGNYDGTNTLDIFTPFGTKDSMRSEIIVPPSTGAGGYQAGPVTDQERSAKLPAYITFCGKTQCDAQVDVSMLPSGSQPGAPIKVILYFKDDAINGDAVYAQGDDDATSVLLSKCGPLPVSTKCVASITTSSGKDKIKTVVVLVPSGNDPTIGKH